MNAENTDLRTHNRQFRIKMPKYWKRRKKVGLGETAPGS
jgi:hypothetical protein